MRRVNPAILAAIAVGLIILIIAVVIMTRPRTAEPGTLSDDRAAGASAPEKRCGSQTTYDRIKVELFRRAAQVRASDQAAFDRLSAYASVRMERPLLRSHDEQLGTVRCAGRLTLDLPPGVAVVGGRRSLSADVDYVLQPAADGSGDVVMIEGADPIVVPLATLARTGETAPPPAAPSDHDASPGQLPFEPLPGDPGGEGETPSAVPDPDPEPPVTTGNARPSFNCRYARTRGEIAVCQDTGLAALDRRMATQFYRALAQADRRQRATLTATRDSFLRYRDRCPTNACIAETYRGRIREIRDIMSGDWQPER